MDLIEIMERRAAETPRALAYTFYGDSLTEQCSLSYGELDSNASAVATWLSTITRMGDRVALAYRPGLEFITAFLGCIYSGRIAVPLCPPQFRRGRTSFSEIVKDVQPVVGLTNSEFESWFVADPEKTRCPERVPWFATDRLPSKLPAKWVRPCIHKEQIALIQYTSGSTSTPKGVMVTHGNLTANENMIRDAFGVTQASVIVSWLPLFHDMGLIGAAIQSLWVGAHCVLLSPHKVFEKPVRWLAAISNFKGTISGGPDWMYRLCAERVTQAEKEKLNLQSWQVALAGSEPIRPDALSTFDNAFRSCGFRKEAFRPCYGLAEATLLVAARNSQLPELATVCVGNQRENRAAHVSRKGADVRELVSSGVPCGKQEIQIVDCESGLPCLEGRIGEIWVCGPNVTLGYWNDSKATMSAFRSVLPGTRNTRLRTGDLGFVLGGELFVLGRIKNLIGIKGRNFYAEELEDAIRRCDPLFSAGIGAAFTIGDSIQSKVVIVYEVPRTRYHIDSGALERKCREAVRDNCGATIDRVLFVRSGTIPRTTSGKVRRAECKLRLLSGQLQTAYLQAMKGPAGFDGPAEKNIQRFSDALR